MLFGPVAAVHYDGIDDATDVDVWHRDAVIRLRLTRGSPIPPVGGHVVAASDGTVHVIGWAPKKKEEETKMEKVKKKKGKAPKLSARDHLTKAVQQEYKNDKLAPSVITAWLDPSKTFGSTKPGFYASIVRYPNGTGSYHDVVAKTSGHDTTDAAIKALAKEWLGLSAAKDALRAAVGL